MLKMNAVAEVLVLDPHWWYFLARLVEVLGHCSARPGWDVGGTLVIWRSMIKSTHESCCFGCRYKNRVAVHIILWQAWVTDAQRCCRDRLAGGRERNTEAEWLASPLWCFRLTYFVMAGYIFKNPLRVDSCNDPKHFICHIWTALWQLRVKREKNK